MELTRTEIKTKFPIPLFDTASVFDGNDSVYILGGNSIGTGTGSSAIYKFTISTEALEVVANFPGPIDGGRALSDKDGNIWYFGGSESKMGYTSNIWKFDPTLLTITNITSTNLIYLAPGFWDNENSQAYFFGGNVESERYKIFTESNRTVIKVEDVRVPSMIEKSDSCIWDGNAAYIAAYTGGPYSSSTIYQFTPANRTFKDVGDIPIWTQKSIAVWDGVSTTFFFAGFQSNTGIHAVQFTMTTKKVKKLNFENFPTGIYSASGVYARDRIYIFGGIQINSQYKYGKFRDEIIYIRLAASNVKPTQTIHNNTANMENVPAHSGAGDQCLLFKMLYIMPMLHTIIVSAKLLINN